MSVSRLINEVLVAQLSIPFRQIVNDTTFSKYTGSKRPDILISEFEYDGTNDEQYIKIICVPTAPWATGPRLLPNCHFIFIFFVQILAPLLKQRIFAPSAEKGFFVTMFLRMTYTGGAPERLKKFSIRYSYHTSS